MPDFHVHMAGHPPLLLARSRPVLTLGRAEEQDLTIRDPTISRHHARLLWREGGAWLEDLGSRHGCFKNGVRIGIPEPVAPWDRLSLGRLPLTLVALPDPGSADPEVTPLSVALSDLRRWRHSGESLDRFSNWKEALDLLHGFSLDMLADLEPEVLLGDLLEQLFTFLDASRGAVLTRNEAGVLAPLAVRPRESRGGPFSLSPATLEATLSRRAAIVFQEPTAAGEEGRLAETPTTSAMAVPLEHDGQVLGLFYFDASRQRGPFTELDLRFVASLSNLAAAKLLAQRTAGELRRKQDLERELQAREAQTQAKGEFLALVSHEIRNPMNIVLGFTYLAQQQALPPKAAEYLEKIERSGRSLMRIVNDTLDFSKLEAGRLALESIRFRPLEVAGEVLDLFAPLAAEKGIALRLEAPEGRPELLGDPLRVGQVLTNLVGNAIKFTDQGEVQVQVRLEQEGPVAGLVRVRFTVRDTGIGIPPGRLAQLFAPYAQGDASMSRRYGGTGLGLAISRRLVEMMGGALTAASTGPGSTFAFTLDLPAAPAPAAGGAPDLRDRRLLLVEDNPLNRQLAGALLAETGARVDAAASGGEALQQLTGGDYDAVLMDIQMPGMDGLETTRRIRATERSLPIIAMTAQAPETQWDAWLEAGLTDFVAKPIEPGLLFAALGRWVPASGQAPPGPAGDRQQLDALAGAMDVDKALGLVGGRADLLVAFLRGFLDDPVQPGAIAAAMARGDRDAAVRMAHDLKGSAGVLALAELAGACADLERLLVGGGPEDWQPVCARADGLLAGFLASARRVLALQDREGSC